MDRNLPEDDFPFDDADDADDAWESDIETARIEPIVNESDANGRPYRVRRRIEEWQEQRALREIDDLDSILT